MNHIKVLGELIKGEKGLEKFLLKLEKENPMDFGLKDYQKLAMCRKHIQTLSHAIKCCEIVEKLPSRREISHILQDFTREDKSGLYYYIHDKDFIKLSQVIHDRIKEPK